MGATDVPYYEFCCEACGPFERLLGLGEAGESTSCPGCSSPARRAYSMPNVASVSRETKKARLLNEKGSEPKLTKKPEPGAGSPRLVRGGRPWQVGH